MRREVGDPESEIWLLGDSNPKRWQSVLQTPFDPRHPARHSIWTPVVDVVQDRVFRDCRNRADLSRLYIRNAIEDAGEKPRSNEVSWTPALNREIRGLADMILEYHPKFLFSFGAFSFEFTRRVLGEEPVRSHSYWGAKRLGCRFRERIRQFDPEATNLLPLLHVSIARGKFIQSHEYFCDQEGANYFEFVGNATECVKFCETTKARN
jgi:hypothetical protein